MTKFLALIPLVFFSYFAGAESTPAPKTAPNVQANTPVKAPVKKETAVPAGSEKKVTCKSGTVERVLELVTKDQGCELNYTKEGQSKVVAQQRVGTAKCDEILETIKGKLSSGGFTCE